MLFIDKNPKSILAEKYRQLRTSIEYSSIDKKIKTIVVTSSEMGEGKSTVAINLACVLGKANKRTIVVDCDLRKPTVHKKLGLSKEKGITDYLLGKKELKNVIQSHKAGFYVLTTGDIPPNPAEIVDSNAMEELIGKLREEFDYVIIDTPPVRVVTDGVVLAGKVDGT
ncbi:MAG: CpsD/CapB family tyrosine-protein kinase, partial [Clostridium sp.]